MIENNHRNKEKYNKYKTRQNLIIKLCMVMQIAAVMVFAFVLTSGSKDALKWIIIFTIIIFIILIFLILFFTR